MPQNYNIIFNVPNYWHYIPQKSFSRHRVFKSGNFAYSTENYENYSIGNSIFATSFRAHNILQFSILHQIVAHKTQKPRKFYSFIGQKTVRKLGTYPDSLYFCIIKQQNIKQQNIKHSLNNKQFKNLQL